MSSRLYYQSPIGLIEIEGSDAGVSHIRFVKDIRDADERDISPVLFTCKQQLEEYFAGKRTEFTVKLDLSHATSFYREVWRLVRSIPFGHTRSYSDIAVTIGRPHASRAVGQANGHNPIPIIIPCHRVLGKNGGLTGYAYGLSVKEALLALENPSRYTRQPTLFYQMAETRQRNHRRI
jgi:methylated-DNA-[protein]-cysteine S-methyltransferase